MAKITWDSLGEKKFEYGVHDCVLYLDNDLCVPWNGVISVDESINETQVEEIFFEGSRYISHTAQEDASVVVTSFTYPEEFLPYFGVKESSNGIVLDNQAKKPFSFSYKSSIGNDIDGTSKGYKINLLFDVLAIPNPNTRNSLSQSVEPVNFSWDFITKPSQVEGGRPSSRVVIDSTLIAQDALLEIEKIIYGSSTTAPYLPSLSEFVKYANEFGLIIVVLNSDGTWTATGPDQYFTMVNSTTFTITNMNGFFIDSNTYQVSSTES